MLIKLISFFAYQVDVFFAHQVDVFYALLLGASLFLIDPLKFAMNLYNKCGVKLLQLDIANETLLKLVLTSREVQECSTNESPKTIFLGY